MKRKTHIIVSAAGSGSRFGAELPKQFVELCGEPVLVHTLRALRSAFPSDTDVDIVVVLSADMEELWQDICSRCSNVPAHRVVHGGDTRWQSVKNAVDALSGESPTDTVLVHDGARPLITPEIVRRAVGPTLNTDGAIPVVPVTDSLRRIDSDGAGTSEAVDRSVYRAVQTPQAFTLWRLQEAYRQPFSPAFTDDASVMEAAGFTNLVLVEGSPENIKITHPRDLQLAELILRSRGVAQDTCNSRS